MTYAAFRESDLGVSLTIDLWAPATLDRMEALSRAGRPAVEAIGSRVAELAPRLDDTTKQHIGRLVRDALSTRGWRPARKARVSAGSPFRWGAVYARPSPATLDGSSAALAEQMNEVRAMVAALPNQPPSVEEFLRSRRESWGE